MRKIYRAPWFGVLVSILLITIVSAYLYAGRLWYLANIGIPEGY